MTVIEGNSARFLRQTLRHFTEMRSQRPPSSARGQDFPDDWFDLPQATLADYGAMMFLAGLTSHHRAQSLAQVMHYLEPPLRLGQYRIFRTGEHPRAFITWAGLSPDVERSFAVEHLPLAQEQWNSGSSVWLVDFVAPFGHIDQIVPLLAANPSVTSVRTLWHNRTGERYRIVEWRRPKGTDAIMVSSYGVRQFAAMLDGAT